MNIEQKHLAIYLPYLIKIRTGMGEERCMSTETSIFGTMSIHDIVMGKGKPILKPLNSKELEKVIDNNTYWNHLFKVSRGLEKYSWTRICENIECGNTFTLPYSIIEKLCSWHFDVFGLIANGAAIDVNNTP